MLREPPGPTGATALLNSRSPFGGEWNRSTPVRWCVSSAKNSYLQVRMSSIESYSVRCDVAARTNRHVGGTRMVLCRRGEHPACAVLSIVWRCNDPSCPQHAQRPVRTFIPSGAPSPKSVIDFARQFARWGNSELFCGQGGAIQLAFYSRRMKPIPESASFFRLTVFV